MAGIKISSLPVAPTALLTDIFPIVQGGITSQLTLTKVQTLFNSSLSFLPLSGGTMSGAINMGTFGITNAANPTNPQDLATKFYVDNTASGRQYKDPCEAGSTAPLTATYANGASGVGATLTNAGALAAFAVDGYSASVGDRILIKDQASSLQNGIYVVTTVGSGAVNWVLTRATDMDQPTEFKFGTTLLLNGTTQQGQTWTETATVTTVGTDPVTFVLTGDATGVTSVGTGTGLTGGPITSTGTISFASIAAHSLWANVTGGAAVPTVIGTNTFLQQVTTQIITSSATYTPTTGMVFAEVELLGPGGGAGGAGASNGGLASVGGGGSAGGYCKKLYTAALIGANAAVVIGTGGAGGVAGLPGSNGSAASTFTPAGAGAVLTANVGLGGGNVAGVTALQLVRGQDGGTATGGDINVQGDPGYAGTILGVAADNQVVGGQGASSIYGGGGSALPASQAGANGGGFGSGGSGAAGRNTASTFNGGNGTNGVCIITEYIAI